MQEILKTDAIVLRARNYNEADQLLSLYTEKAGKLTAIVKGVRKPKSKLRGGVQVFSHTHVALYQGRSLATVTQAETINTFVALREDLLRMGYASYLAEFVEAITPDGDPDSRLFSLVLMGQHLLSVEEPWLAVRVMEVRLLMELGYQPQLDSCVNCGQKLDMGNFFAPQLGGVICSNCNKSNSSISRFKIRGETYVLFKQLMQMELSKINRLRISKIAKQELEELLDLYILYCLGKKLKTKDFLKNLISGGY